MCCKPSTCQTDVEKSRVESHLSFITFPNPNCNLRLHVKSKIQQNRKQTSKQVDKQTKTAMFNSYVLSLADLAAELSSDLL